MIITEGTTVDHPVSSYSVRTPAFHGAALQGWKRVVNEVHDAGACIIPQLWHVGIMRDPRTDDYPNRDPQSVSPSGVFKPGGKRVFNPIDKGEIRKVHESFARAAVSARELGFDGIEIHGAHGYLIDQFLWSALNLRIDEYGGTAVERTRFAVELIERVRAAVGPDFPIVLRVSQWKQQDYGARLADTPEQLKAIFQPIADAGVDIFHISQRRYWDAVFAGSPLNGAGWIKRLFGRPTITVGSVGLTGAMSVTELGRASEIQQDLTPLARGIDTGEFDIVAVGRALLTDPAWARKIKQGRFGELRPFTIEALETLS